MTRPSLNDISGTYFKNLYYTELVQLIFAFSLGVIFAPFSYGPLLFIIYLLLYEFIYAYFTNTEYPYWRLFFRVAVVMTSVFGWIIGRTIVGWKNPFRISPDEY